MNPSAQTLNLRDIHLPGEPGFWPPAPGWWLLAFVLLAVLVWLGRTGWRRYRIHRQRQRILALLDNLEKDNTVTPDFLAQLSILLRRLALMRFPRQQIASLTGCDWLRFLDSSGGNGQFCEGPGRVLADGPYLPELPQNVDVPALTRLVRDWIRQNSGR